jgi:hypothetical protein
VDVVRHEGITLLTTDRTLQRNPHAGNDECGHLWHRPRCCPPLLASRVHQLITGPGLDEPGLIGGNHRLRFLSDTEFRHHVGKVCFHGSFADEQLPGDFGVGQTLGQKDEDFPLARGQLGHLGRCGCVLRRSGSEFVDELAGDGGIQPGLASGHRADRGDDLGGGGIFEKEA